MARIIGIICLVAIAGCNSPEAGRPRGGGHGGDGGNYRSMPVHAPSKIDGTMSTPTLEPR